MTDDGVSEARGSRCCGRNFRCFWPSNSSDVRIGNVAGKGYYRTHFDRAFATYSPDPAATSRQVCRRAASRIFKARQRKSMSRFRNSLAHSRSDGRDVAAQTPLKALMAPRPLRGAGAGRLVVRHGAGRTKVWTSSRTPGRHQVGTVGGIKSEWWARSYRYGWPNHLGIPVAIRKRSSEAPRPFFSSAQKPWHKPGLRQLEPSSRTRHSCASFDLGRGGIAGEDPSRRRLRTR
jgi:hypothetical protein